MNFKIKKLSTVFTTYSIAVSAVMAVMAGAFSTTNVHAQSLFEGYLCCNMRSDSNGWISDINYNESGKHVVPLGTPAKMSSYGKNRLSFETSFSRKSYRLGNDYSRNLDMETFAARYIVREDPNIRFASFPPRIQNAIKTMRISRGMTKEQVLMAIGYPIGNETPILEDSWKYWYWTFSPFTLHWDDEGRIARIETDPDTLSKISVREPQHQGGAIIRSMYIQPLNWK
jgi:hypothetical protein